MTKGRSGQRPWSTGQKLTLASVLISAMSFGFAVCALLYTVHKEREMKIIDLLSHFQQRYDQITYEVKSEVQALPEAQARPLEAYYYRFWDLQLEQYQAWKAGFITPEIYSSWMEQRQREWGRNWAVGGKTYQDGWRETKEYLNNKEFADFMDKVFAGDRAAYADGP